jgi:hypothetical protein
VITGTSFGLVHFHSPLRITQSCQFLLHFRCVRRIRLAHLLLRLHCCAQACTVTMDSSITLSQTAFTPHSSVTVTIPP